MLFFVGQQNRAIERHLVKPEERHQAVQEATRLLKPHGWLFAAGINRPTYLRDLLLESALEGVPPRAFHEGDLRDGNFSGLSARHQLAIEPAGTDDSRGSFLTRSRITMRMPPLGRSVTEGKIFSVCPSANSSR